MKRIEFNARCWQCGRTNNSAAPTNNNDYAALPDDGDLLMCFYCGAFMVVDKSMPDNVHKPTPAENFEINNSKEMQELYGRWLFFKMRREKPDA